MTFEPSPHHLGPFVGIHVFGKKHGDAWTDPWTSHNVSESTSALQIQGWARPNCVSAFHRGSWTREAALTRGSSAGGISALTEGGQSHQCVSSSTSKLRGSKGPHGPVAAACITPALHGN